MEGYGEWSEKEKQDALKYCYGSRNGGRPIFDEDTLQGFLDEPLWSMKDRAPPRDWAAIHAEINKPEY